MPNKYPFKPRGIVKWHAFAAVIGGDEQKQAAHVEDLIDIDLFDDKLLILNQTITDAIKDDLLVKITYVHNNKIHELETKITKVDTHLKQVSTLETTIKLNSIIDLIIL